MRKTKFHRILSVVLVCMLTLSVTFGTSAVKYDDPVGEAKATGVTVLGGSAGKSATSFDPLLNGSNATTNDSWSTVADATDVYITFDLGKSIDISKVVLTSRVNGWAQWFNAYKFYVTDDAPVYGEEAKPAGLPETAALEGTSEWLDKTQDVTYEFPANTTGRYITLYMDKLIGGYYVNGVKKYNVDDDPNTPEDNATTVIAIGEAAFYVAQKASDAVAMSTTQQKIVGHSTNTIEKASGNHGKFSNMYDGNLGLNGYSQDGLNDFYVTFEMETAAAVSQITVTNHKGLADQGLKDYEIYVSETAPSYDGTGTTTNTGPAPTGIGKLVATGSLPKQAAGSKVQETNTITCETTYGRYVTLHAKTVNFDGNTFTSISEFKVFADALNVPFTSLEVDDENGKLVMPKADHYTATIASSSNTNAVALDGTLNTIYGGTSEVVLKFEFIDGKVGLSNPFTVKVDSKVDAFIGDVPYLTFAEAMTAVQSGETILLNRDISAELLIIDEDVTIDLGGCTLTADYVIGLHGSAVIDSADAQKGRLVVAKNKVALNVDNKGYLPVYDNDGYVFTSVDMREMWLGGIPETYAFSPVFETAVHTALTTGATNSGVKVVVRMTWVDDAGQYDAVQDYIYRDSAVKDVVESFGKDKDGNPTNLNDYGLAFYAYMTRTPDIDVADLYVSAALISDTGAEVASVGVPYQFS